MKKLIIISVLAVLSVMVSAQAPQMFNYQAVVRDVSGNVISDQNVSLRMSIVKGTETGAALYTEIFLVNTGSNGLVTLVIGGGNVIDGNIADIDWSLDSYYLKIELDAEGGSNYRSMGASKLLSVPYALYSAKSGESGVATPLSISYEIIQPSCNGNSDGSILLSLTGGQPPYDVTWSSGDITTSLENIIAGTYQVAIIDQDGQTINRSIIVNEPQPLSLSLNVNDIICAGNMNGSITSITSGGNGVYSYSWSNGESSSSINNLSAGEYSLIVTDHNGCTITEFAEIAEPPPIIISSEITPNECHGGQTGSIDITVNGGWSPYYYSWNYLNIHSEDLMNLPGGIYTVNILDKNNCSINETFTVQTQNSLIQINGEKTDIKCKGDNSGAITLTIEGGNPPYLYSWSNGSAEKDISDLGVGSYSVTVTDNLGCYNINSFVITEPSSALIATIQIKDEFKAEEDGAVDLTIVGGNLPYQISWSNGSSTEDLDNISAGSYTYSISDKNGCIRSSNVDVGRLISLTDIDGNVYDIVKIDNQFWTAENLKVTKYADGWSITQYRYPNNDPNVSEYGLLYDFFTVEQGNLCPSGWHVPTDTEWTQLIEFLNGEHLAGGYLKEAGTTHWYPPNTGATNETGFTALPADKYDPNNTMILGYECYFWSSTASTEHIAFYRKLYYINNVVTRGLDNASYYMSVRCLKDQ